MSPVYNEICTLFADTGLLTQIGLGQTMGLLGLDYRQHCYNCLSPALSVVFVIDDVIDDAGSVSGQLQEAYKRSVAIVNQARVSTAPFNYILSTVGDKGFLSFFSTSVNNCQNILRRNGTSPFVINQINNKIVSVILYTF